MEYELYELQHHGVKGMKWGVRKADKYAVRTERKYARAGRKLGAADYERSKGDAAVKSHNHNAEVFERAARNYDKQGSAFKAEAARKTATALRARGQNIKAQQDELASFYEARAQRITEKASTYATKKRVDLGKSKVDSILKESRKKGFEYAKSADEYDQEQRIRDTFGEGAVSARNWVRGT